MAGSLLTKLRATWKTIGLWEGNYEVKVACSSNGGVIVVRAGLANESGDGVVLQPSAQDSYRITSAISALGLEARVEGCLVSFEKGLFRYHFATSQ